MEALKMIPIIFLMLAIAGIVAAAGIIMVSDFGDTMDKCYNSSYTWITASAICNSSGTGPMGTAGTDNLNLSDEYYAMTQVKEGMSDVSEQFPTIGIIAVMVIIISLIAGVFVYMRFFR